MYSRSVLRQQETEDVSPSAFARHSNWDLISPKRAPLRRFSHPGIHHARRIAEKAAIHVSSVGERVASSIGCRLEKNPVGRTLAPESGIFYAYIGIFTGYHRSICFVRHDQSMALIKYLSDDGLKSLILSGICKIQRFPNKPNLQQ